MTKKVEQKDEEKIIQMMPITAPIFSIYKEDDGALFYIPIIMAVLTDKGNIELLEYSSDGIYLFDLPRSENFVDYHYGPLPKNIGHITYGSK